MDSIKRARHRSAGRAITPLSKFSAKDIKRSVAAVASSGITVSVMAAGMAYAAPATAEGETDTAPTPVAPTATVDETETPTVSVEVTDITVGEEEAVDVSSSVVTSQDVTWDADVVAIEGRQSVSQEEAAVAEQRQAQLRQRRAAQAKQAQQQRRQAAEALAAQEAALATQQQANPAEVPDTATATVTQNEVAASSAVEIGLRYLGVPYRLGGSSPRGFDCSGFTQYVYRQIGIELPRTSWQQRSAAKRISAAQARPGDLVFWPRHVGIYVGNGKVMDAVKPGRSVTVRTIWGSPSYGRVA